MGVFDRQVASAKRMIKKYGESCTWVQVTNGTPPDPNKPWIPSASNEVSTPCIIAFFPTEQTTRKKIQAMFDASEVPMGMETGYMAQTTGVSPTMKDIIVRKDGSIARILDIDTINPNGEQDILYTITVEK